MKRADKAMVKVPEASNRSSRVIKVINDAVNIGAPFQGMCKRWYLVIGKDNAKCEPLNIFSYLVGKTHR